MQPFVKLSKSLKCKRKQNCLKLSNAFKMVNPNSCFLNNCSLEAIGSHLLSWMSDFLHALMSRLFERENPIRVISVICISSSGYATQAKLPKRHKHFSDVIWPAHIFTSFITLYFDSLLNMQSLKYEWFWFHNYNMLVLPIIRRRIKL